ncbi:Uncharacterized protein Fot_38673 [Forsythia ovata]|uniref:Uncharacterized protein n=1 Tax=Forsythia ovata TaxID=205694 RepID=A0ABD1S2F9_9LAMI
MSYSRRYLTILPPNTSNLLPEVLLVFFVLSQEKQKHSHTPDPIEAFNLFHKRKDNHKSWIDDAYEQMGANISQELTQLVATHGEETPELRLQAYVTVRGFETGGRVRGYGDVVTLAWCLGYRRLNQHLQFVDHVEDENMLLLSLAFWICNLSMTNNGKR